MCLCVVCMCVCAWISHDIHHHSQGIEEAETLPQSELAAAPLQGEVRPDSVTDDSNKK